MGPAGVEWARSRFINPTEPGDLTDRLRTSSAPASELVTKTPSLTEDQKKIAEAFLKESQRKFPYQHTPRADLVKTFLSYKPRSPKA